MNNEVLTVILKWINKIADYNIDDSPDWLRVNYLSELALELTSGGNKTEGPIKR